MPLRLMQYTSNIYETLITMRKKNKYGSKLIPLPVPRLVTFYNGKTEKPEEMILRLSDAFPEGKRAESDIEVKVRMININPGNNAGMAAKCKPLQEYIWTVGTIRENRKQMDIGQAIDKALDAMPDEFEIKPYLEANRVGVKKMLLTEYNETETMELFREEGRQEGREEGRQEGREEGRQEGREEGREEGRQEGREEEKITGIRKVMAKLNYSAEEAMELMDIPQSQYAKYALLLKEN